MKKTEVQIFDSPQPQVLTDTGSGRVFIHLNERQVKVIEPQGPDEEPVEVTKYAYDVLTVTPADKTPDGILTAVRKAVDDEITAYDNSDAVNDFTYQGRHMWLDDTMRTRLDKRLRTDEADGYETTKVTYEGTTFELPIAQAKVMLHHLESYARDCFDRTAAHHAAIAAMTDIADIAAYDYTTGYPPILNL